MRFPPLHKPHVRRTRGVALIIVLAFVVLLTGLVVAFFSRSLSERQISNSSAGQVKIDLFTQGAIATITDDLKQEIAAGSNATYYTDAGGASLGNTYLPVSPSAAVPALALKGQSSVTAFAANLLKRSAYQQNFFPSGSDAGAANYNTGNTVATVIEPTAPGATPSPSAAPARPPANRAAGLSDGNGFSTTIASQNGRAVSTARWNKAMLLPKNPTNLADPTKLDPATTAFAAPDWILVARDGSNPGSQATTASFSGTISVNNAKPSNKGFVTGRYAYTIYDEGGLLDANVAGYPTAAAAYPSNGTASIPITPTGKATLAYADLTIPVPLDATGPSGGNTQPLLTGAQVNALVGWRNYASSKPVSGTFPNYVPAPTASPTPPSIPVFSPFDLSVLGNLNGFMGVSSAPLYNHQSDRMFGSRQELINFFTQGLPSGPTDTATLASLQNSLQYFGTFSRGLNQPSYMPVSRVASATNPNARPLIQPSAALGSQPGGGNNVGDNYTTAAQQDIFSPSLLSVRVLAPTQPPQWVRNDGTTASIVGEPLLKSRFALQRLAWITYKGPSVSNPNDPNLQLLISNFGLTDSYIKKGTVANIQNYFGLNWDATKHCWLYNVHNGNGATSPATGAIMKLQEIADQAKREPDFFEVLKASIDPGVLAKASTNAKQAEPGEPTGGGLSSHTQPLNFQFARDINVDAAIIQIGANIIDQYDIDGYPTRIIFDDGSGPREIRGTENLPYIYRIRLGGLKIRESIPPSETVPNGAGSFQPPTLHSGTMAGYTANALKDTGAGVVMAVPDVWDPYDQNSFMGSPRPGTGSTPLIRLVANSATPDTIYTTDDPPPAAPSGYSTFTSGTSIGTDAPPAATPGHGGLRATSFLHAKADPSATPAPIPNFTRGPNADGKATTNMSGTNGGFNYPHVINTTTSSYLTFKVPNEKLFREPTMLGVADPNGPSGLTMVVDSTNLDILNLRNTSGASMYVTGSGLKSVGLIGNTVANPLQQPTAPSALIQAYCGITLGTFPLRWVGPNWSGAASGTVWHYPAWSLADTGLPTPAICYSLQYQDPQSVGKWITYDEKYVDSDLSFVSPYLGQLVQPKGGAYAYADPRTPRFGSATENNIADGPHYRAPLGGAPPTGWLSTWLDTPSSTSSSKLISVVTERPDISSGFGSNFRGLYNGSTDWGYYAALGLHSQNINIGGGTTSIFLQTGMFAQNDPNFYYAPDKPGSDGLRFATDTGWTGVGNTPGSVGQRDSNFWSDPDGVVRRAMGAYVTMGDATGQPLATATTFNSGLGTPNSNGYSQNRPIILNRPFRNVGELGYVFTGNPWKNIDFSTPESGYSALLDVFCANDNAPSDGLVAGKVNLNTRQPMVLKAILTGAYTDEENAFTPAITGATPVKPLAAADADAIATLLTKRTSAAPVAGINASNGPQPLQNVGDLVGRWNSKQAIMGNFTPGLGNVHNVDGSKSYDGFSGDLTKATSLSSLSTGTLKIPRIRESAVRALSNVGNTRVWNLMIDVIAQSGRYPSGSGTLNNFVVDGEQRYWVHLAIDRYTGAVLDTKLELVKE